MPSPADRTARRLLEQALRATALLALAGLLAYSFQAGRTRPIASAGPDELEEALTRWTTRTTPGAAHVVFREPPSPVLRDWLAALPAAGTAVSWSGAAPTPSALAVEPVADPQRPTRVWVAAPAGTMVTLEDRLGALGEVVPAGVGARITVPQLEGGVRAVIGAPTRDQAPAAEPAAAGEPVMATKAAPGDVAREEGALRARHAATTATAALRDSLLLRPVLVLAESGWEAKFVMAALEERGWQVHARLALGPSGDLRQGPATLRLDTASYAAIIALDSVAARYAPEIRRYVEAGGGLVAAGEAAGLRALARLLPAGNTATPTGPSPFPTDSATSPRTALDLTPLHDLAPDAIPLEHRGSALAVAARRLGEGRVLQVGYRETWRWRLAAPNATAVEDHRNWWSTLVSGVAYAPRTELATTDHTEPTPRASLVAALGPATQPAEDTRHLWDDPRLPPLLLALAFAALLTEWGSRRLRGER